MARLHELTTEYSALQAAIEEGDSEARADALAKIGPVEDALKEKNFGYVFVRRNLASEVAELRRERDRVQALVDAAETALDEHDAKLLSGLIALSPEPFTIQGPSFKVGTQYNPHTVVVEDEDMVPPEFCHPLPPPPPPPKRKVNRAKVLAAMRENLGSPDLAFLDWQGTCAVLVARLGEEPEFVAMLLAELIEADLRFFSGRDVPDEFLHPPCGAPNKKAIAEAHKKLGENVLGTRVERGVRLVIK